MLKLIKRKGSKHYHITGTLRGERIRESTGTDSEPHAQVILAKRQSEILDRQTFGEKRTAIFAEAVELYLQQGGEARFLKPLLERWGLWRIADITQAEVSRAIHEMLPGRSPSYQIRAIITPLSAVVRCAHKAGLCDLVIFEKPRVRRKPVVYAQDDWFERVLPHCSLQLGAIIMFLTTTGCRVQEACDLTTADVNLDLGEAVLLNTKNGTSRLVQLVPVVVAAINRLHPGLRPDPGTRVFGYASRHSVNQAIDRACARAGAPYLSSHKIGRHAFAARLLRAGHSVKLVQEAGGWKVARMVTDTYGHLEASHVRSAVRDTGNILTQRLIGPKTVS